MPKTRILVVDDERHMTRAVRRALMREHVVVEAGTPDEALQACRDEPFDMAILDISMPLMNGFELMDRLRETNRDLDVVFMTGSIDPDNAHMVQAIRKGAFYYIQKPFENELLSALVQRCLELRRARGELERQNAHQERQLAAAREFQLKMLPPLQTRHGPLHVRIFYRSCHEVGGDLCDYVTSPREGDAAMLLADIAGKGAGAAMLTSAIRYAFRTAASDDFEPRVVTQRILMGIPGREAHRYATAFCMRVSAGNSTLEYVNAGHQPGILARASGEVEQLNATGPPVSPDLIGVTWEQERVPFGPGDRLLLYSDGVVEAMNDRLEMFDSRRLREAVAAAVGARTSLLDSVIGRLDAFRGEEPSSDDVSLLEVRFEA